MRLSRLTGSATFGAAMLLAGTLAPTTVATSNVPGWYRGGHRIDAAGDLAVKILGQQASSASPVGNRSGTPCKAETSATGNVQVNCVA